MAEAQHLHQACPINRHWQQRYQLPLDRVCQWTCCQPAHHQSLLHTARRDGARHLVRQCLTASKTGVYANVISAGPASSLLRCDLKVRMAYVPSGAMAGERHVSPGAAVQQLCTTIPLSNQEIIKEVPAHTLEVGLGDSPAALGDILQDLGQHCPGDCIQVFAVWVQFGTAGVEHVYGHLAMPHVLLGHPH